MNFAKFLQWSDAASKPHIFLQSIAVEMLLRWLLGLRKLTPSENVEILKVGLILLILQGTQ